MKNKVTRQSNFELLRLLAQFFIVLYHILLFFVYPSTNLLIYKALYLPLHIGVILFVLISGYFTIKPTSKGFIKLIAIFTIYSLPEIYHNIKYKGIVELFFVSKSHFWFVKTYIFLYILSPLVNFYLKQATTRQLIYIVLALFFVSQYMGMTKGDINMSDGKNVVNFIFIYSFGQILKQKEYQWKNLSIITILPIWLILNLLIISLYYYNSASFVGRIIWTSFFQYSGTGLLLNSIIFFIMIGKMSFNSKIVNYMASSSLAIYLIHPNRPYFRGLLGSGANFIINSEYNEMEKFIGYICLSIMTIFICITIDKILTPLWNVINLLGNKIYIKLGF